MADSPKVIFSGENPDLTLYKPGTEDVIVRASYWRCVYSEAGDGSATFLWLDGSVAGQGGSSRTVIFTDNPGMAKIAFENMNKYFGGWDALGFESTEPTYARFFQEGDGRWYHRLVSNTGSEVVEMSWRDIIEQQHRIQQDFRLGPNRFDLTTVICPCRSASISINNQPIVGEVRVSTNDGKLQSSAFLAFAETWSKYEG